MLFSAGKAVYHVAILFRRMGFSQKKKKKVDLMDTFSWKNWGGVALVKITSVLFKTVANYTQHETHGPDHLSVHRPVLSRTSVLCGCRHRPAPETSTPVLFKGHLSLPFCGWPVSPIIASSSFVCVGARAGIPFLFKFQCVNPSRFVLPFAGGHEWLSSWLCG